MNPGAVLSGVLGTQFHRSKPGSRACRFAGSLFLALLLLPSFARALTYDGTGIVLKNGGKVVVTGTGVLPAAQIYAVTMDLTGTTTGGFTQFLGPGPVNLRTALTGSFGSFVATQVLGATCANLKDKLPATLATGAAYYYYAVQLSSTTYGDVVARGDFSLKLNRKGQFTGQITHLSFATLVNRRTTKLTGNFVATSGTISVVTASGTSATPQPDIMVLANPHIVFGCGDYVLFSPGDVAPVYPTVRKGSSHTVTYLVQNDGPSIDTFVFESGSSNPIGFKISAKDGRTAISAATLSGTGYPITLAPGAIKAINVKATVLSTAPKFYNTLSFSAQRSADSSNIDWAGENIYVP